ncbi:MAG: hypothetical protein WCG59_05050 [Actinomycetes bacterium]
MTTTPHHQLDLLRLEWRSLSRSAASRDAAVRLCEISDPLQSCIVTDMRDVLALLEPASPLSQQQRARVAADLLALSPDDALMTRALLQTLLPGIIGVARRLRWGQGSGDDPGCFLADLITATYELIVEWGGQDRPYAAPDLLNALRCRMRRRLSPKNAYRTESFDTLEQVDNQATGIIDEDPTESLEARILAAKDTLDPVGAAAFYGREVLGMTYRELAAQTGISPKRLAAASREVARRIWE